MFLAVNEYRRYQIYPDFFLLLNKNVLDKGETNQICTLFVQVSPTNSIDYLPYNSLSLQRDGVNHLNSFIKSPLPGCVASNFLLSFCWLRLPWSVALPCIYKNFSFLTVLFILKSVETKAKIWKFCFVCCKCKLKLINIGLFYFG